MIGNPPYVYRNALDDDSKQYFLQKFMSAEGNFELYKFFIEKNIEILREGGLLGMIVSASFLVQASFTKLRKVILENMALETLAPLGPRVFERATVDTAILIGCRREPNHDHYVSIQAPSTPTDLDRTPAYSSRQSRFSSNERFVFDYRLSEAGASLFARLVASFPPIESAFEFGVGINTGYIRDELVADSRVDDRYHRMVPGSGISRYGLVQTDGWIMYDPEYVRSKGRLGRTLPPRRFFDLPKVLVVRTRNLSLSRRIVATIDRDACYNLNRLSNIIAKDSAPIEGLLGILNSSLFNWLFSTRYYDYEIKPIYLRACPMADSADQRLNDLVNRVLNLQSEIADASVAHSKTVLQRQIEATDREIDQLVYQLYGLSDAEIAIVEEATKT